MKRMKKWQGALSLVLIIAIIAALGFYATTIIKGTKDGTDDSLKLGLDLAGGVSITYQAVGGNYTDEQMEDTVYKLQQRVDSELGENSSTEGAVYRVGDDRIAVEVPGVKDANALLEELGSPGDLYFIRHLNDDGEENYAWGDTGYQLNYTIEELTASGDVVLTGQEVASAAATYERDETTNSQKPVVQLTLNDSGTEAFAEATRVAYNNNEDSIAIYYDGKFVSVPSVSAEITNGQAVINGMEDYEAAESLASYIRIGGLNVQLQELESRVVGATLGSDALSTAFLAAVIGLIIVMVFMIAMYRLPGLAAAIALAIYSVIMIAILYLYDIALSLSGIAGIILSVGMAVDANVIIFARIREEIATGKGVKPSIDSGFQKALSAILDGNITTLIAAAVLGGLGSGMVKGFAITLAIGVLLSMFTALVITRWIMNSFYALGLTDEKLYGRAKKVKVVDFIGKKAVFFAISLLIICVGLVSIGVHSIGDGYGLNYSLEFLGGTSTTVDFEKEYSLAEIDSDIVPLVSEITGDNDIQTSKVDDGTGIIFKTRTLSLEEREELNAMFEENFGVTEDSISSENISSTIGGEMRRQSMIAVIVAAILMLLYIWFRFKDIRFASSAIIALIHDVLVVLALYAVARISVGSAFIACMLTVIGYSVNDTIVIFDRIRENIHGMLKKDEAAYAEVANTSISQTLSRSISTSITTAIMVLMLLILGVSTIREFALPLLIGVITGTYSSICLATELWYLMKTKIKSK